MRALDVPHLQTELQDGERETEREGGGTEGGREAMSLGPLSIDPASI